jgi:hypothetical protein
MTAGLKQPEAKLSPATTEEYAQIREELPEIDKLSEADTRQKIATVWASFLRESPYRRISDAPALPGIPDYDLAAHTRHVIKNCLDLGASLREFSSAEFDDDVLLASALAHDASKLVEFAPDGSLTELGRTLLHAQVAGVRCYEVGLDPKVAYNVTYHPFTPPHIHVKPRCIEFVILSWADLASADPIFFARGLPTHLDIDKRFFTLD